jgi:hypothetical protein
MILRTRHLIKETDLMLQILPYHIKKKIVLGCTKFFPKTSSIPSLKEIALSPNI